MTYELLDIPQGGPAWHAFRRTGVGGSEIAAVMGLSPWRTRAQVLAEKLSTAPAQEDTFAMRRGRRLEPVARELACIHLGVKFVPAVVRHAEVPWVFASLDGLSECRTRLIEIKCGGWESHDLALAGIVPEYYAVQCQWQLLTCGLDRCDFVSFNDGQRFREADQLAVVTLRADAEVQARCLEAAEPFWAEVVAGREKLAAERQARREAVTAGWA